MFYSALARPPQQHGAQFWSPQSTKMRTDWRGPKEGHNDQSAGEPALGGKPEGVKSVHPGEDSSGTSAQCSST